MRAPCAHVMVSAGALKHMVWLMVYQSIPYNRDSLDNHGAPRFGTHLNALDRWISCALILDSEKLWVVDQLGRMMIPSGEVGSTTMLS